MKINIPCQGSLPLKAYPCAYSLSDSMFEKGKATTRNLVASPGYIVSLIKMTRGLETGLAVGKRGLTYLTNVEIACTRANRSDGGKKGASGAEIAYLTGQTLLAPSTSIRSHFPARFLPCD